jgi:signal transduction histidine kinase
MPPQPTQESPEHALRIADLSELLAHVNASQDDEKRALARQLHDSIGSSLTALTMHLDLLAQQIPPAPALQDRTAQIRQLLLKLVENNRDMQTVLWNDKLEFLGAKVALTDVTHQFEQQHQTTVRCSLPDDDLECAPGHALLLLRALEEGLNNIAAHAQARTVDLIVDDDEDALTLTLKDDGIGLQGGAADGGSGEAHADLGLHGLRLLRERLRHLGGTLTLTQNPERGARMTVSLPKTPVQQ